ncbi:MAG TPA: hypothetical protein VIM84_05705, partial [Gemmatimonadales bacterium]
SEGGITPTIAAEAKATLQSQVYKCTRGGLHKKVEDLWAATTIRTFPAKHILLTIWTAALACDVSNITPVIVAVTNSKRKPDYPADASAMMTR